MKKNDAGYALPLVLVVMTILCLIAVTVMTFSLDNLQSQQASIAHMQAKYEAQGKLEKLEAKIEAESKEWMETTAGDMKLRLENICHHTETELVSDPTEETADAIWKFSVSAIAAKDEEENVQINCDITLALDSGKIVVKYDSYTVTTQPKGGQDG